MSQYVNIDDDRSSVNTLSTLGVHEGTDVYFVTINPRPSCPISSDSHATPSANFLIIYFSIPSQWGAHPPHSIAFSTDHGWTIDFSPKLCYRPDVGKLFFEWFVDILPNYPACLLQYPGETTGQHSSRLFQSYAHLYPSMMHQEWIALQGYVNSGMSLHAMQRQLGMFVLITLVLRLT